MLMFIETLQKRLWYAAITTCQTSLTTELTQIDSQSVRQTDRQREWRDAGLVEGMDMGVDIEIYSAFHRIICK